MCCFFCCPFPIFFFFLGPLFFYGCRHAPYLSPYPFCEKVHHIEFHSDIDFAKPILLIPGWSKALFQISNLPGHKRSADQKNKSLEQSYFKAQSAMASSANASAILTPTEAPGSLSNSSYSLSLFFSSSQAQQATVALTPVSTAVTGLDQCANQQFYLATAQNFFSNTMMFVSCDANNTETAQFMNELLVNGASCVVFYSAKESGCAFDPKAEPRYRRIPNLFTMISAGESMQISSLLSTKAIVSATISAQHSGSGGGTNNSLIALYVVIALLAVILFTMVVAGAIRVRRHPERYGIPSAEDLGYRAPYSTRARGLARAVLDSIPLVRVAEPHSKSSDKEADVGATGNGTVTAPDCASDYFDAATVLSSAGSTTTTPKDATRCNEKSEADSRKSSESDRDDGDSDQVLHTHLPESAPAGAQVSDTYIVQDQDLCPICFENFMRDEILRALPCNHRFHADCVDPWLLNESSECPLCRIDLALVNNPNQDPSEPTTNPRFRGLFTQRWRRLVRSRRQRLQRPDAA